MPPQTAMRERKRSMKMGAGPISVNGGILIKHIK